MNREQEDFIIKRAIEKGLLLEEDCVQETTLKIDPNSKEVLKWGYQIARLLQMGLIDENALAILIADIKPNIIVREVSTETLSEDLPELVDIIPIDDKNPSIKREKNPSGELTLINTRNVNTVKYESIKASSISENSSSQRRGFRSIGSEELTIKPNSLEQATLMISDSTKKTNFNESFATSPTCELGEDSDEETALRKWDRYKELKLIGVGGMGKVFRAIDPKLNRAVALKFVLDDEQDLVDRFIREARIQAKIEHQHICKIHEIGEFLKKPYIAMQYIDGISLDKATEILTLEQKVRIIKEVSEALHAAHKQGLIHRDIKPSNILLESSEEKGWWPYILDFGLAREVGEAGSTAAGAILGTPSYMSPEQAKGKISLLDRRSDVYSLGATLYELLTGVPPFKDKNYFEVILKITQDEPVKVRQLNDSVPEDLEIIVMKCLEKDPQNRYQSAKALAEDLRLYLDGSPITARSSKIYKIKKLVKKHKARVVLLSAATLIVMFSTGMWIYTSLVVAEREKAEQTFGQEVKEIEQILHYANTLPLRNVQSSKTLVEIRINNIKEKMDLGGKSTQAVGHYALGCGYIALRDYETAKWHLEQAWNSDYKTKDTAYALGYALGEIYQELNQELKNLFDKNTQEKEHIKLTKLYRDPAIKYLTLGSQGSNKHLYVEALIAFYQDQYDIALQKTIKSYEESPWLYEAKKLEGKIYQEMANKAAKENNYEEAFKQFDLAKQAYQQAIDIGRSDADLYESEAERNARLMELLLDKLKSPETIMQDALDACNKALIADPDSKNAYISKAKIYFTLGLYQVRKGEEPLALDKSAEASQKAIEIVSRKKNNQGYDSQLVSIPYGYLGTTYYRKASYQLTKGIDPRPTLDNALAAYGKALNMTVSYGIIYKNVGDVYWMKGRYEMSKGLDATKSLLLSIENYKKAMEINKGEFIYYNALGNAYEIKGEYEVLCGMDPSTWLESAIASYKEAMAINPNHSFPYNNSGIALRTKARYEMAIGKDPTDSVNNALEKFEKGISLGSYSDMYRFKGEAVLVACEYSISKNLDATEKLEEARSIFEKALELNSKSPEAYLRLGETEMLAGCNQIIKKLSPKDFFKKAEDNLNKSLELNPENAETRMKLAECFYKTAEYKMANKEDASLEIRNGILASEKALELNPKLLEAMAIKGLLLLLESKKANLEQEKLLTQSKELLETALQKNPLLKHKYGQFIKN